MTWGKWCGVIFVVLATTFAAASVRAHEGMSGAQTAPSSSPPAETGQSPDVEMSWPTGNEGGMAMGHKPKPKTMAGRIIAWLGTWHPAVIHFPIALTLTVVFLELLAVIRHQPIYAASSKILLAIAVLGAFVAAPLGWANAGLPSVEDSWALNAHRWLGTFLPFLLLPLWLLKRPVEQTVARQSPAYAPLLGLAVLLILAQAYLGAEVTHGANHLAF